MDFSEIGIFQIDLEVMGLGGHASRCENIIKGGLNLNFHMVIKVAIQPQYLATLTAILSTVRGPRSPLVLDSQNNLGILGLTRTCKKVIIIPAVLEYHELPIDAYHVKEDFSTPNHILNKFLAQF